MDIKMSDLATLPEVTLEELVEQSEDLLERLVNEDEHEGKQGAKQKTEKED